jgi:hypothetical protein
VRVRACVCAPGEEGGDNEGDHGGANQEGAGTHVPEEVVLSKSIRGVRGFEGLFPLSRSLSVYFSPRISLSLIRGVRGNARRRVS